VLSRPHRLTASRDFTRVVRAGARAGSRRLVVHASTDGGRAPARVGVVVGRAVGTAVVRNRVKRRLRHLAAARVSTLPDGAAVVLRALPPAATASYVDLGRDLDRALVRALERAVTKADSGAAGAGRALETAADRSASGGAG
jgi:ribonuclease P protein component